MGYDTEAKLRMMLAVHAMDLRNWAAINSAADELAALRQRAEAWQALYRRAINEANGLTNYVEDRPELRDAERRIAAIEAEARAAIDAARGKQG